MQLITTNIYYFQKLNNIKLYLCNNTQMMRFFGTENHIRD